MTSLTHAVRAEKRDRSRAIVVLLLLLWMLGVPGYAQQDNPPPSPGSCAANGDVACIERFVDEGRNVNLLTSGGASLIHIAVGYNKTDVALLLLAHRADPNADDPIVKAAATPLMLAVDSENVILTKALLDAGADPNAHNDKGETPLMLSLAEDNEIFDLLLAAKPDLNAVQQDGYSALSLAVRLAAWNPGQPKLMQRVQQILAAGADPNLTVASASHPPIAEAADGEHGNKDLLALLLAYGADPNIRKPLLLDKIKGRRDLAELLIDNGLEIDLEDTDQKTALALAVERDDLPQAKLLLELGADPDRARGGPAPLGMAVTKDDVEMVRLLLEHGANPDLIVGDRQRPLSASEYPNPVIREWMQARVTALNRLIDLVGSGADADWEAEIREHRLSSAKAQSITQAEARFPEDRNLMGFALEFNVGSGNTQPVPPEALRHEQAGNAAYEAAQSRTQMLAAAGEFAQALGLAPWVPAYARNACVLYLMGGAYGQARPFCAAYQTISPPDVEAFDRVMAPYGEKAKLLDAPKPASP